MAKKCTHCGKRRKKIYRNGSCPLCSKKINTEWREKNSDKNKEQHKKSYKRNGKKHRAATKRYYKKHKKEMRAAQKKWNDAHEETLRIQYRERRLLKLYNMSLEDYDNLLKQQKGVCAICKQPNLNGKNLAVDHDHKTGKVRGLLCSKHNRALGAFLDDLQLLKAAVKYLEEAYA
jgi:hypothetical protein